MKPSALRRTATFLAMESAISFSRTPCGPMAPASLPPWPASTTTRRTLSPSWAASELCEARAVARSSRALVAVAGSSSDSVNAATASLTARTMGVLREGGASGASGSGSSSSLAPAGGGVFLVDAAEFAVSAADSAAPAAGFPGAGGVEARASRTISSMTLAAS